jgi:hypothetical protein
MRIQQKGLSKLGAALQSFSRLKGFFIRSYLKIRIFGRYQGEAEDQPAGILKYIEDLRRGHNADIGRKDFIEMASRVYRASRRDRIKDERR